MTSKRLLKSFCFDIGIVWIYQTLILLVLAMWIMSIYGSEPELARTMRGAPNWGKIVMSYLIGGLAVWLYKSIDYDRRASRFVMLLQLLFIAIPFLALYGWLDYPSEQVLLLLLGYGATFFFIKIIPVIRIRLLGRNARVVFSFGIGFVILYVYVGLIATGGIARFNLNFADVYEARADFVAHGFWLSGYVIQWVAYVFNMVLLTYFILTRKRTGLKAWWGVLLVLTMQIILFGMTSFKSFVFLPFAVGFFLLFSEKIQLFRAAALANCITIAVLLVAFFLGNPFGAGIVDRVFVVPAALHSLYFNYFSTHPYGLMQGTMGSLLGSGYDESIILAVAEHYWGRLFWPNVGWIGDAFANFGVIGIVVYALVLAVVLNPADYLVKRSKVKGVAEGLLFGFALGITGSALPTSLLTGGYFVAFISLWVLVSHLQCVERRVDVVCGKKGQPCAA